MSRFRASENNNYKEKRYILICIVAFLLYALVAKKRKNWTNFFKENSFKLPEKEEAKTQKTIYGKLLKNEIETHCQKKS